MTCLLLFYEFFKTGLFAVGGGLATLPFLYDMAARHPEWFTVSQLADMLAVSESTPGPLGVNMATYVGYLTAGIPGAVAATMGLVAPSVIVILIVAAFLKRFRESRPGEFKVVLMDVQMPEMDGLEVLRSVRKWSSLPIVVVSARNHERDKVEALDYGADDYLVKPFGTSELLARIRTAIRHTRTSLSNPEIAQSGRFTTGDLVIDYDKHQVLIHGENARLTANEYRIVSLLGKYAGKVLTYDFIIKELWGPKAKNDNQILRVNMANIRRKIEENPGQPKYIFTEVGVGYRMREGD